MAIVSIDHEVCTGCGECVLACAPDVIRMDAVEEKAEIRYPEDCHVCEQCIRYCPAGAITVTLEKTLPLALGWE